MTQGTKGSTLKVQAAIKTQELFCLKIKNYNKHKI